jgi:F-type H+-transporting ATPase subunit b
MLIDWFTVGAQAINFIVLVWLLKRFLYKPILRAIDEREKLIAGKLADAEKQKAEAQKEREEFEGKNKELEGRREELLLQAAEEAGTERVRLLEEARKAAEDFSLKRQNDLRIEELNLHREIFNRTQREVFAVARKTLADLAGASLEERIVRVFIGRLRALKEEEKVLLSSAINGPAGPLTVRTAFDLPPVQTAEVAAAVKEIFGPETGVRFDTVPDLISGIELSANGHKVAWSIENYLSALEGGGKRDDEQGT